MTSDSRPNDSPLLSATSRLSSRDRRSAALLPAAAPGPAAFCGGVVVMAASCFPRTLASCPASLDLSLCPSAASLARAGERPVHGVALPVQATTTRARRTRPPVYARAGCGDKKSLAPETHMPE